MAAGTDERRRKPTVTREFIVPRGMRPDEHPVDYFWELLDQLGDDDYPSGVLRVPETHPGTWGFSAGAGLVWWPGTPRPEFPMGGIMFVGANLNAYGKWLGNSGKWGDPGNHTMIYWQRVLALMRQAGIPTSEAFFTNAYVGLIDGDNPSAAFPGRGSPTFCRWCASFLVEQIRVMRPRLVVALGGDSRRALESWNIARRAGVDGKIVNISHPSNRKGYAVMVSDAAKLRQAYDLSRGQI